MVHTFILISKSIKMIQISPFQLLTKMNEILNIDENKIYSFSSKKKKSTPGGR